MALIIFLLLLLSILFIYYHFYYKLRKLPPGPTPLPLLGNLLQMSQFSSMELALLAWRRQYGPVTYWLGNLPVVAIADYQKMVETVVKDGDAYTDRQTFPFERVFRGDDVHGIISSSGERWREQRRFALHVFRDFGVGKNLMQDRILDEITAMFHKLNKQMEEEPESEVNLCNSVDLAVGSIINNVMFGYRLEGEREPEFWEIKHMLDEHMKKFGNPLAVLWVCYPFVLDHVPYFKQMGQGFQQRLKYFFEFFERKIVEHPRDLALDSGAEPRDYVEAFLKEKRRRELAGEDHRYFTITQLSNNCFDLWIAGQETTSNVLAWAIACLLNHQNALEKLYAELDAVIGNTDRLVTVADRQSLPYTNAVINETLRVANIIPFNIRRTLSRDVCLDGYLLAKGTCIVPEISVVLCDDNIFAEASKFKPERFLDEQGKLQRCDELVPFSQGKRQCLGEPLARMELFLFIANIFNRYKVMSGRQMPSLKRTLGAVVRCEPFTCRMEKR